MASIRGLFSDFDNSPPASLKSMKGDSIERRIVHFYENGLHTDVEFHVKCGESFITFFGHKLVLSLRSPAFADMFFGPTTDHGREVDILDVLPSAFETLLKFCYGLNTELNRNRNDIKFLLKVYKAATKYEVEALKRLCCQMFCSATPTKGNVFDLLDASDLTGLESLKLRCYKVLQSRTKQILSSQEIGCVGENIINTILDMPTLSLDSEYDLLCWLFDWASYQHTKLGSSLKEIMSPYLSRMNFTSLKAEEFELLVRNHEEFVGSNGLFDASEGFAIFRNIISFGSCSLPDWMKNNQNSRTYEPK